MESLIARKAAEARSRSAMQARALGSSGGSDGGNPLGLGGGGGGFNIAQKRNDMGIHAEQYRHNTGWVAASIGPIAKRIARQPIRLARVSKGTPEKTAAPSGRKATVAGVLVSTKAKPWEKGSDEATPSALWFKQRLPGPFKTLAPSAELIDTHPILDAIDNPNPIMVRWSMMFVTIASLMLTGKAYWWVKAVKGDDGGNEGDGTPRIEIWPLPSSWVKAVHTEEKLNDHYEVTPEGALEATPVPPEQIVYFYLPDPSSLLGAQSPLQNQARAVVSDEAIAEAQRRGFANGVFPGVAVVVGRQAGIDGKPGERPALNREQRAQIITAFKQAYRGVYNHDEPIILDRLIEDVRRVTNTNREMDFQQSGAYTKERITQGFGVNPIVMGQVEGANRASSATADDHLCQSTVNPLIELISQTLSAWMNPLLAGPGERFCLFIEEARAVDPDSDRSDWEALWNAGACSKNEYRAGLRNLPPMVNGDTSIVPAGSVEIDARLASEAPEGAKPPKLIGPPDAASDPEKPTAPIMIAPKPPEPAQNSEPGKNSSRHAVAVIDLLADMGAKRFTVSAAQAVMWSIIFGIPARKATRCVEACAVAGKLVPLEARHIVEVVRILKEEEGEEPEANPADTLAVVEIAVSDIRQKGEFDCGAAVAYAAALAQGLEPGDYTAFMVALDTEDEIGTMPEDIFAYFAHNGCDPLARPNRTIEHLRAELRKGRLCILPVQYFGDGDASGAEGGPNESGHYILVNGYTRDTIKYQCPLDGPGEIACNDLLGNWYDRDQQGRPFVRYCLSVGPRGNSVTDPQTNTGNTRGRRGSKVTDSSGHEHGAGGRFNTDDGASSGNSDKPKPKPSEGDKPKPAQSSEAKPPSGKELEDAKIGKTLHPNVQIRHHESGDWVVKGRNGAKAAVDNEVAASTAAKAAGVEVPQVHHVKMYGQDQAVVQKVEGKSLSNMTEPERRETLAKVPKEQIDKHALFDYAIGSSDPNHGNYIVKPDNSLVAIDKEQSLGHGHIGNKATARIPFFLAEAQPAGRSAAQYEFDPKNVKEMATSAEKIAQSLEASGKKKDAEGVRRRGEVLKQLAETGKPVTAQELATAGEKYDKTNPPAKGLLGKIGSIFGR